MEPEKRKYDESSYWGSKPEAEAPDHNNLRKNSQNSTEVINYKLSDVTSEKGRGHHRSCAGILQILCNSLRNILLQNSVTS